MSCLRSEGLGECAIYPYLGTRSGLVQQADRAVARLASQIVAGQGPRATDPLTIEQFEALYRQVEIEAARVAIDVGETQILILSGRALVRFAIADNIIVQVHKEGEQLAEQDFRVVIQPSFDGNVDPITVRQFLSTEICQNGLVLLGVAAVSLTVLWLGRGTSTVQTVNQMLVEANALFIGMFVLFTVTQNKESLIVPGLIRRGFAHRMMQNDRYVAWMAIASLLAAFLGAGVAGIAGGQAVSRLAWAVASAEACSYALTTFSLVLLVDCLLSVTRYYLHWAETAVEARMYREIMGIGRRQSGRTWTGASSGGAPDGIHGHTQDRPSSRD